MRGPLQFTDIRTHLGLNPLCMICCCPKDEELGGRPSSGRSTRTGPNPFLMVGKVVEKEQIQEYAILPEKIDEVELQPTVSLLPPPRVERVQRPRAITAIGIDRRLTRMEAIIRMEEGDELLMLALAAEEDCYEC